jgi:hypothetical protein
MVISRAGAFRMMSFLDSNWVPFSGIFSLGNSQKSLSAGGKKFTTAHECPFHISTEGSLPRFIGLRGKK